MPAVAKWTVIGLSGLVALSALAGSIAAPLAPKLVETTAPAWWLFAFELLALIAGVTGLFIARPAFAQAPGLGLLCVAGMVVASSVCGYLGVQGTFGPHSLKHWLLARLAAGGLITLAAAYAVLSRNRRSYATIARGLACLVPLAAIAVVALWKRAPVMGFLSDLNAFVRIAIAITAMLGLAALLCAGAHFIIRAFESCRQPAGSANSNAASNSGAGA
ncbi:MAG: hypothetical protein SFY95_09085 [Planctomycetota bacterium]|nr:hypothetical protein [Planctomycetota bacterium]